MKRLDVGLAAEEPEELMNDRLEVDSLRGNQREAIGQIEPHLPTEDAQGPGAGAVRLGAPGFEDMAHEVEILLHGSLLTGHRPDPIYPSEQVARARRSA